MSNLRLLCNVLKRHRFWLVDCKHTSESSSLAHQIYREATRVPFRAKFIVYAKSHDPLEARIRIYCVTDDKLVLSLLIFLPQLLFKIVFTSYITTITTLYIIVYYFVVVFYFLYCLYKNVLVLFFSLCNCDSIKKLLLNEP